MKLSLILLLICFLGFSCSNVKSTPNSENLHSSVDNLTTDSIKIAKESTWLFDSLSIEKTMYLDDDTSKHKTTVGLSIKYPVSTPKNINLVQIQQSIAKILQIEGNISLSLQSIFKDKLKSMELEVYGYQNEIEGDEEVLLDYQIDYVYNIDSISNNILSSFGVDYTYLGGAHGYAALSRYNIDIRTGKILLEEDLFINNYKDKLAKLIQNEVRRRNEIPDSDEHIYLLVKLSEIKPNNNFSIVGDGLTYFYNQYEIAPYVQGIVEITIPRQYIRPLIKDEYKYLFQ